MNASRLAVLAAIASVVAWGLKAVAIGVAGGLDKSPLGVVVGFGLSTLAPVVAMAVVPDSAGWVEAEAGLWFSALLALGATVFWHTSRGAPRAAA